MASEKEIDEIKERINIYDIVSSYIKLKKSGSNYFGLCPFHNEKSPSFSVNPDMGIFKCFGCQESGDVITFMEKMENITFKEAIEKLADMAGIKLSHEFSSEKSEKKRILEMNSLAQEVFTYLLNKHQVGVKALHYLQERHISKESIKEFGLGYDHQNLVVQVLKKHGFSDKEILTYGLGVIRSNTLVDKYRGRIIFPIFSMTGDVVGFAGRIIVKDDSIPKYINSPETEVFKKNAILYGLYNTKKNIKEKDSAVLLEGPVDVISAFQNGLTNVAAAQGTSLTANHIMLLKRLTDNIVFCFDQDPAGLKAMRRSYTLAIECDVMPKMIKINNAKDIDERVNSDKKGFMEDISSPIDLIEYLINTDVSQYNGSTLDGKLTIINDILPLISRIKDDIKRNYYIAKLAEAVQLPESEIKRMMQSRNEEYKKSVIKNIERTIKHESSRIEYLLALFLQNYKPLSPTIASFNTNILYDLRIKAIIIKMQQSIEKNEDAKQMINSLDPADKEFCLNLMTVQLKQLKSEGTLPIEEEIHAIEKILTKKQVISQMNELKNQLWVYEKEHDEGKTNEIMIQIAKLTQAIS